MRHFNYLTENDMESFFHLKPGIFKRDDSRDKLSYALGATLYMPAVRKNIIDDLINRKHKGLMSMVICMEDSIGDDMVEEAEKSLVEHLKRLDLAIKSQELEYQDIPLIFIRVRNALHLNRIYQIAGDLLRSVTGFVFPKFTNTSGERYFEFLKRITEETGKTFYAMPILESPELIYWERRNEAITELVSMLDYYSDLILNIRIGGTDFCGLFGIRRSFDVTIYDISVIRDCIAFIVNTFCRVQRQFVVSGPVWEYFSSERILKPQLRVTPFRGYFGAEGEKIRSRLLDSYTDGLMREVLLDKANGLIGKTVIHPSHIVPVQALYVVTHEEYMDAVSILSSGEEKNGAVKSSYSNKMNEIKPHKLWAEKIIRRAEIFGVFHEHQSFTCLL
ncbi:MAG: HpcH/HpaI aldolase/citrate lyase family protein [Bacillota bacterium]|nr:HpcH/HpaI aldolase/citrate lyase family protein [Bacillota bacterium]